MKLIINSLFFLTIFSCFGQTLSKEEQLEDLRTFKTNLYSVHPSLFRFILKADLDSIFYNIDSNLHDSVSINDFSQKIAPVFSAIKDAHTWQRLPLNSSSLQLPLDLKIISNQLYVRNNVSSNPKIQKGDLIESINNEPTEEILNRLRKKLSTDGGIETTQNRVIEEWFRHMYDTRGAKDLSIKINSGAESFETTVELLEPQKIDSIRVLKGYNHQDRLSPPYFNFEIQNNVGILTISHFAQIPWEEYTSFLDESIETLNKQGIENLILDLRWNIGGPRDYPIFLYSKLTYKPFEYIDHLMTKKTTIDSKIPFDSTKSYIHITDDLFKVTSGFRGAGLQYPDSSNYKGNIYLLIDGQSNSSSGQIASLLKSNNRGIIIGEEAGGIYSGGTGEYHHKIKLEHSQILIQIPRYRIVLSVDHSKNSMNKGTIPDYEITNTLDALMKNKDLCIEKAFELIKK